ncbi:glycosyl hydrolase catalytic core-domain-containing protein [Xylaria digitata]|nr:glycosyl hydrolase catalytic core-domain-containing protein [Xylaria digitata]
MHSKASLMALCAAAAVKEVAAGHGHQHLHADKREIVWAATETVIVTDYVTVTVTEGEEPTAAAVDTTVVATTTATTTTTRVHRPHHSHSKQRSSASSSSTSTSTPVVVADPTTSVVIPTVIPTTMVTAVKPTTTTAVISTPSEATSVIEEPTVVPTTTAILTTATTASSVPTTTAVASSGGKRGLAYNDANLVKEFLALGGEASWAYNWGSTTGDLPSGVTYYPMLWSPASDHSNGWDGFATAAISNGADALLSFNEPDIASQANMSPQDAAASHIQWMNPYAGKARISSPAISSSENANQGVDWLNQFFSACNGKCQVDFCAAHWYGPGGDAGAGLFLSHLKDVKEACNGKPVWVTEFAAESDSIDAFMRNITTTLETDPDYDFVEKYSYFMASVGQLFTSATELSSFGRIYAGIA